MFKQFNKNSTIDNCSGMWQALMWTGSEHGRKVFGKTCSIFLLKRMGLFLYSFLERLVLPTQEERDSFLFHSQYILCLFSCKDIVVSNYFHCSSQKRKSRKEAGANVGKNRSSLCYLALEKDYAPFHLFFGRAS